MGRQQVLPRPGAGALPQVLAVGTKGAGFNFSSAVFTASGGSWLTLSNNGLNCCVAPETLTVGVDAATLLPGVSVTGGVVSVTVTVWLQVLLLPQQSVACHVRLN